ncbi:DUF1232 domain-containing protein [Cohnella terricola]|uniref:DUF1232 domain-containing protein n=1 Tax=Cohnella terricola TaxID=1289167 RepID=UPI001FE38EE5|nr:DUF1232 domain-containing protein [Cohnella terricola]
METFESSRKRSIGELIKDHIQKNSLSMRKLANLCGIDVATVSRIVNGKQQPKLYHLQLFSRHLNIPLDKLIETSGEEAEVGRSEGDDRMFDALDKMLETFGDDRWADSRSTRARIEQELAKCEQYAKTEEGHRLIRQEFDAKIAQLNGAGPFIERLKRMYGRYCDNSATEDERALLGSALLYFILSVDIIPDYIFPIGYVDDAIAVNIVTSRLNAQGHSA